MKHYPLPRYKLDPAKAVEIQRRFLALPEQEHVMVRDMAQNLANDVKNLGEATGVQILWAIGRLLRQK